MHAFILVGCRCYIAATAAYSTKRLVLSRCVIHCDIYRMSVCAVHIFVANVLLYCHAIRILHLIFSWPCQIDLNVGLK